MKVVLLLGGSKPADGLLRREMVDASALICADRGAQWAVEDGFLPSLLVGDMDSLPLEILRQCSDANVPVRRFPSHKDATDGELAVDCALEMNPSEVVLLGALGGRLDHLLGNLQLLLRLEQQGVRAKLMDEDTLAMARQGDVQVTGHTGDTLSVLPLAEGLSVGHTEGLAYPLPQQTPLPLGSSLCISNRLTRPDASLHLDGWGLVVLHEEKS